MGTQALPPPGQQDQPVAEPPSWKKILLGMIPMAGPLLVAHGQQVYQRKLQKEQETVQGKVQPYALATQYAENKDLDPETRLGWQQLQADMAIHNEEHHTAPYKPEHVKQFQDLLGKSNQQIAIRRMQDQQSVPQALLPAPGSQPQQGPPAQAGIPGMMPQGAGPAKVNAPPGAPPQQAPQAQPTALPPPPGMAQPQQQDDPIAQLHTDAQSPNPLVRGPALNLIREMRNSVVRAGALVQQGMNVVQAYEQSGAAKLGIPFHQFGETLGMKVTSAPLVLQKPGETLNTATGQALSTAPEAVLTPEGGTSTMVTPTPVSSGQATLPPPPGSASNVIASSPGKISPAEAQRVDAARLIAEKYKIPFDPTKDPKNPTAQLPNKLLAEFNATAKALSEDPELKQLRLDNATARAQANAALQQSRSFQQNMQEERRTDRSRTVQASALDKVGGPVTDALQTFGRLNDLLNTGSPQADALIAPILIKAEAGGQGSGVRITKSEIDATNGGRTGWESVKSAFGKWNPDSGQAFKITAAQRQQIRQIAKLASDKLQAKQRAIESAKDDLLTSDDPSDHLKTVNATKKKLAALDMGTLSENSGSVPTPTTQAAYDALPKGAQFLKPGDSKVYTKQ